LNEQAENNQRGAVFAGYMVAVSLGLMLGQGVLIWRPELDFKPLLIVAICFAACLLPVAMTKRLHPAKLTATPFYALAPVFATLNGLSTAQASTFVAASIFAGLCGQWPMGWLSDRIDRSRLIRCCAVALGLVVIPLWGLMPLPYPLLLVFGFFSGMLLFTLYPLAVALANDNVEQARRVPLSAMMLATHGIGACLGPVISGALMSLYGQSAFYLLFSACALLLIWRVQPKHVTGEYLVDGAPLHHVAMPEHPVGTMAAMLDPRVDEVPQGLVINPAPEKPTA
ncbi:MAG: MFS transporter, partial [Pseudomonas sp.]